MDLTSMSTRMTRSGYCVRIIRRIGRQTEAEEQRGGRASELFVVQLMNKFSILIIFAMD